MSHGLNYEAAARFLCFLYEFGYYLIVFSQSKSCIESETTALGSSKGKPKREEVKRDWNAYGVQVISGWTIHNFQLRLLRVSMQVFCFLLFERWDFSTLRETLTFKGNHITRCKQICFLTRVSLLYFCCCFKLCCRGTYCWYWDLSLACLVSQRFSLLSKQRSRSVNWIDIVLKQMFFSLVKNMHKEVSKVVGL